MSKTRETQLDRVVAAGAADFFELGIVCGLGLVGSFVCQCVAPLARRLICLDFDRVSETTTLLSPYHPADIDVAKARAMARFVGEHFEHLRQGRCVGAGADVRLLGEGFWKAAARLRRAIVIVALDDPGAVEVVTARARQAGLACVVATVGPQGAEAIGFPPDPATPSYSVLGLSTASAQPCLEAGRDALPTISTPHVASLSAAIAIHLAMRLVSGALTETRDERIAFGPHGIRATTAGVQAPSNTCMWADTSSGEAPMVSPLTTEHSFEEVAAWLRDSAAVLHPETYSPVTCGTPAAQVPLSELGIDLWPLIRCHVRNEPVLVELRGDAADLGVDELLEV